jgi:hypothetical protein
MGSSLRSGRHGNVHDAGACGGRKGSPG